MIRHRQRIICKSEGSANGRPKRKGRLERQTYLDHRKLLTELETKTSETFDKAMLTLPAGALALTITFIKDIAGRPPEQPGFLLLACGGFGASLLSILSALVFGQLSQRRFRDIIDKRWESRQEPEIRQWWRRLWHFLSWERNYWAAATMLLNWASVVAFLFGVVYIALFAIANLT
ncbi:MAG: hypothetical protein ACM3US_10005 [Sphingomonadaceae bacterium]